MCLRSVNVPLLEIFEYLLLLFVLCVCVCVFLFMFHTMYVLVVNFKLSFVAICCCTFTPFICYLTIYLPLNIHIHRIPQIPSIFNCTHRLNVISDVKINDNNNHNSAANNHNWKLRWEKTGRASTHTHGEYLCRATGKDTCLHSNTAINEQVRKLQGTRNSLGEESIWKRSSEMDATTTTTFGWMKWKMVQWVSCMPL